MSKIDDAIARIQDIVLSSTDLTIKAAPDWPTESLSMMPLAITHIGSGSGSQDNATTTRFVLNLKTDVYFDVHVLKLAYQSIDKFIPEFIKRLGGDPTLNGTVQNIVFPIEFVVEGSEFNTVPAILVSFNIPVKVLENPIK